MRKIFKKLAFFFVAILSLTVSSSYSVKEVNAADTTVTYTVESTSTVSVSGTAPAGSSATYKSTYGTECQLTKGNSMTLTLSGYDGYTITGLKLSMKSNSKGGRGSLSAKVGNDTFASIADNSFNNDAWYGSWSTSYVNITPSVTETTVDSKETITITIAATANSLYCQSFTLDYYINDEGESTEPETPVPTISLTADQNTIKVGNTTTITASVENAEENDIVWSISPENIASISGSGKTVTVMGKGIGTATITASIGDVSKSIDINVEINPDIDLETNNPKYVFANYPAGTQYAENEVHKLDNNTTITTTQSHFTTELRIYASNDHPGFAILDSVKYISGISLEAAAQKGTGGLKFYKLDSNGNSSLIENKTINTSKTSVSLDLSANLCNSIKIVAVTNQIRIDWLSLLLTDEQPVVENPISNYETNASLSFNYKYNYNEQAHKNISNSIEFNLEEQKDLYEFYTSDNVVKMTRSAKNTYINPLRVYASTNISFSSEIAIINTIKINANNTEYAGILGTLSNWKNVTSIEINSTIVIVRCSGVGGIIEYSAAKQTRWNSVEFEYSIGGSPYTDQEFSNVKIGFSASVNVDEFGGKSISKAGVIFTSTDNAEKEISKTISNAIMPNIKDTSINEYLDSNNDYRYLEKSYTEDKPLEAKDGKYVVGGSMSVINGEVTEDNISRLSKTITAAIYFVVDGEVIILQDKTYSVKGMLNEYSTNVEGLTEKQLEAVNVFKAYIEG